MACFARRMTLGRQFRQRPLSLAVQWRSSSSAAAAPSLTQKAEANYKIVDRAINFQKTQASRPDFEHGRPIEVTKHPNPQWDYGQGAQGHGESATHREVDPYATDRPMVHNYRLLVAGIAPRPVGLISTLSADGETKNLSPFSYFQVIDHDPPMFIVGFSSRPGHEKDTFRNLKDTGECVINTVSESMIEAVNASSIDAPYGMSEWEISGLHEASTSTVKPSRVQESVFSIEGKVVDIKEFGSPSEGMSVAGLALIKATRFWVREDATNEDASHVDLEKLRPVAQLGGMSYGRIVSTFELPRKRWHDEYPRNEALAKIRDS
ncbi:FMN-binding split barrel [Purpureocillium lavendulum]|uniref:FMN-binding split barrel n=1 Tax=Purpureocillium lavendulum TaxID=1247861 RepID=A0AB34FN61_9HYPO|nr:FMN-binding split barrel [Purpureocillium lavendulum]